MSLRRTLGPGLLTFYAVGMIVGAGVYSVIGAAASHAGDALWASFALGAIAAVLTGLSYAELATMFPRAGAEYVYLREAVPKHRWPAYLVGWVLIVSGVSTATTVSLAFAGYLGNYVELPDPAVALALLGLITAINLVGIKESAIVNVVFTLAEVAGLVLVIWVAASRPGFLEPLSAAWTPSILPGAALVFFAYLGFEEIANLAEETRDPGRTIPRVLLVSIAITAVLYVLVAIAVIALVDAETLAASESPLTTAVGAASPLAARIVGAIALFATANTGLITLVATSRLVYGMAKDGDLPRRLRTTLPGRKTPWLAALMLFAMAAALLPLGGISAIASLSSFGALVAFLAVNTALLVLRRRQPDTDRPFRVPLAVRGVPVPTVLAILAAAALLFALDATTYLLGGATIVVGLLLRAARRLWD